MVASVTGSCVVIGDSNSNRPRTRNYRNHRRTCDRRDIVASARKRTSDYRWHAAWRFEQRARRLSHYRNRGSGWNGHSAVAGACDWLRTRNTIGSGFGGADRHARFCDRGVGRAAQSSGGHRQRAKDRSQTVGQHGRRDYSAGQCANQRHVQLAYRARTRRERLGVWRPFW